MLALLLAGARHLAPGQLAGVVRILRESEHPLAEDVAHDVRCPAFDRVRLGPPESERDGRVRVDLGRATRPHGLREVVSVPRLTARALEVERKLLEPLVELGLLQL